MSYDKNNEMKTWKCAFLFSGEEPCVKGESGGGVKNRVIEVECKGKIIEDGNAVFNFVCENYGLAGSQYINYVRGVDCPTLYREIFNEIITTCDTTDKQAGSMALMLPRRPPRV